MFEREREGKRKLKHLSKQDPAQHITEGGGWRSLGGPAVGEDIAVF